MSAMFLHLLGKDGIRATGGDDVIKDEHLLTLEKRLVKIHDAHLGNLLLSSSSALMNCQAVFHQDKMGITILEPTLKSKACLKCLYFTKIISDLCCYLEYFSYLYTIN